MPTYLRLLGRPQVEHAGRAQPLPAERPQRLLVLLALRRAWVGRPEVAELLWPGQPNGLAAANVRKALHLARTLVWAAPLLEAQGQVLRFVVDTDLHDFEVAAREGRIADALAHARGGELLDGMDDAANAAWSEWLDGERALHRRRRQELTRLRLAELATAPAEAAALARTCLEADPLDEDAVVALLAALRDLERYHEQHDAYRSYASRLVDELGVEPSLRVREAMRDRLPGPRSSGAGPEGRSAATLATPATAASGATPPIGSAAGTSPLSGFVGRVDELGQLTALLSRADCRLLTVLGPGGVGKSSLLKAALPRLAPQFDGGALWIPLDDLTDTTQVLARIATECRLPEAVHQAPSPLQALCEHLRERRVLLVLDNGEHLTGLGPFVERLIGSTAQPKICVTSRTRLGARNEWLLPLQGLALAPARGDTSAAGASDAARLFASAAHAVKPDFDAAAEAEAVDTLMHALGGLPLAILLAANWARLLPVSAIAAEIERSLDVLQSAEEGEERAEHRSVRATFERSWQMLGAREERALGALSVFVGSFTREAAQEVAGAALPLLAALADKSLLQMSPGNARCSLHPLIRRFAGDKLDAAARADALRRHAAWFHGLLARSAAAADAADRPTLDAIGDELENCRQAWRWAVQHREVEMLAGSATALRVFFTVRARVTEGLELLLEARPLLDDTAPPAAAAALMAAVAQLQYRVMRLDDAAASARAGIHHAREGANRVALVRCLSVLGMCGWQRGQYVEARRYLDQAMRRAHAGGDARGAAMAQGNLALVEKALGNHARARQLTFDWVAAQREAGEWLRVAIGLNNLAFICQAEGDWEAARAHLLEGLALCDRYGMSLPRLWLLTNLSNVHTAVDELDQAEQVAQQVLEEARAKAQSDVEANALNLLVRIAIRRGDTGEARSRLREAVRQSRTTPNESVQLDSLFCFARIAAAEGDAAQALPLLRYYLARPNLEPVDRADAEACMAALAGKKTAGAQASADAPLADLLARVAAAVGA